MDTRFAVICDLDGVLHRASRAIPGARRFVAELQKSGRRYMFLTNSPDHSPRELRLRLKKFHLDIDESHFYTSAQAIGEFLACHSKRPRVYMVGSPALRRELQRRKVDLRSKHPEYVVFSTGGPYGLNVINRAVEYVQAGAHLLTATDEPASLTEKGVHAGCGALVCPVEKATGQRAYVIGKPNHFMIRQVEQRCGLEPSRTLIIGDSLETDIDVGLQAQMKTVLVLTGHTSRDKLRHSPYKPDYVFDSVADIDLEKLP